MVANGRDKKEPRQRKKTKDKNDNINNGDNSKDMELPDDFSIFGGGSSVA